jgi:replicative DNA helicase
MDNNDTPRVSLEAIAASLKPLDQALATLREGVVIERADGVVMLHRPPYYDDTII